MALSDERERKSTIKGQEYATEMKYKALGIAWKNLQRSSEELRNYMNENPPVTEARLRYTKWMTSYEAFILANDQYCNTLNEDALQDHDNDWFCEKTVYAENRKSEAEKWFLSKEVVQPVAGKAKTSKSRSSMGSVARRQEELKRLEELKKQSRILKEKQESEKKVKLLEIELEQEKERNALDKEMARSEARQEMLEELEAEEISLSQDLEEEEASSLSGPSSGDDQSSVKQTARIPSVAVSPKVNKVKQPAAKKPEKRVNDAIVEMRKPKLEIKKFNGNCMDFNKFMRQFKTRIESGCTNDDRMAYLEQFTTGEAQQIVIGYSYLEAEVGYPAAMKELKRRYGDPEVIANSYVKKLLSWAPIKANDPKALDEFSVFFMECKAATLCVGSLGVLEFSENIRMTMEKLPQYLHDRWRNVVEVHRNQQRPIRFSDIVDFTQKEAKKLNDPVYGKTPVSRETTELQKNKRSNTTFSVQSSDTAKPKMSCHYCQEQHWLSRCPGFKAKSVDGRRKFVREKKLCWNCFNKGHFASSCPKPSFCKMCAEKHSSFLHPVSPPKGEHTTTQPAENQKAAPPETQAHSLPATSTSLAVAGSYQRIGLSVVPVQVKAEGGKSIISTYAFLDNGSNITFCTEALAQKLGVKGKGVDLNLMTMDGQSVTKSTTISLEVANLYGSSQVKIPRVYTRQSIPVSTNTIASQAEVDRWPHLQGIYIPSITAEIELLIGQDVPEVHQPYEVRAMQNGGPYATRTLFGWVVNGPLSSWQENKICGFVGNLDEQFRKFCSIEFNDLESDQVTMSQSDIQALTSMEESVTYKDGHYHVAMPWKASPSTLPNNRVLAERRLKKLQAALLAARLDTMIREELKEIKIDQSVCWTDSTCVLRYLSNDETRFKTYVGNRILSRTNKDQWRFVNSAENPANLASRGMTAEEMMTSEMWYCGPKFLTQNDSKWPEMPDDLALRMNDPEVKGVTALVVAEINTTLDEITSQFSSWKTLSRVTGWVLRFTNNLKNVKHKKTTVQKRTSNQVVEPLSVDELKEAELVLIRRAQKRSYPEEFRSLETGKTIKSTSPLIRLDPKLENGVLKVGGRLSMADVSGDLKHQIILPRSSDLTILILRHYHNCTGHSGVNHVLSELRQIYWPVGGRTMIKGISRKCVQCRRRNAPTAHQKMADLPAERVTPAHPPFTFVGIDCFGPFKVKNARSVLKRYGVIFTCLSIRAVHLEVASSLDTNSFLNAYRRFVARRGVPKHIRSDNGGNFIMGQKELRSAINDWNQGQIHQYLSQNHVEWKFNPPAASHQGGVWERCIRTVRKVLSSLMEEQTINDETLQTLFCEVETIVNGRPITKVSDDPKDNEALTPNHLLLLRAGPSLPPGRFVADDCYVRRRWRQTQYLADVFWRRWLREYLPALQERQKWCKKQQNVANGDIVLVHDPSVPRCSWPLARVIEVLQNDSDGMVRSVRLKTSVGTLVRPITKIILLEVNRND
ncbi:uncharacterized protein [Antedon mediterranea]|uniref:uncharacterized protein n=1 Tax=Antedon mediterranea TaxID=105859 RepID=UPI003AF9086E